MHLRLRSLIQDLETTMDHSGASEGPEQGRTSAGTSMFTKGQRSKLKITPFHSSPIVRSEGAFYSKRPGAASGRLLASSGSLFVDTPGHLTALPVKETLAPADAAQSSPHQIPSSDSHPALTGQKVLQGPHVVKVTS